MAQRPRGRNFFNPPTAGCGLFPGCLFTRQALMLDNPEEMLGLEHTVLKKPVRTSCPCEGVVDSAS